MGIKLGVITDLHADLGALRDALQEFDRLGVDRIVCAGDIVDGGDQPTAVIALLREWQIPCVRGNHDRWAMMRHDTGEPEHDGHARRLFLSPADVAWLAALPKRWDATIEGVRIAVRHGTPGSDMEPIYPDAAGSDLDRYLRQAEADVLIVGHTHIPVERPVSGGRLVVNPGALWRGAEAFQAAAPEGGGQVQGGCYGVLECPSKRWTQHRLR